MTWLLAIRTFLKGVPWQIWAGVALVVAFPVTYCAGERNGKQIILERLEQAEDEAKQKAAEARATAAEGNEERAREFEHEQDIYRKAIDDAEEAGSNPLDAIFNSSVLS